MPPLSRKLLVRPGIHLTRVNSLTWAEKPGCFDGLLLCYAGMGRSVKDGRVSKTKGFSLHPELEARVEARAKSLGLSWSGHVRRCIEMDLIRGGVLEIRPQTVGSPDRVEAS